MNNSSAIQVYRLWEFIVLVVIILLLYHRYKVGDFVYSDSYKLRIFNTSIHIAQILLQTFFN